MGELGCHYALSEAEVKQLRSLSSADERRDYVHEVLDERPDGLVCDTESAWDAIHRCFTGQAASEERLDPTAGKYPDNLIIVGGEDVNPGDEDHIMRLIAPDQLSDLIGILTPIDEQWIEQAYHRHCKGAWPEYGPEDCEYTIYWFGELKEFLLKSSDGKTWVLFSAFL